MFNPCLTLLVLHLGIFLIGSMVLWAADRRPRTIVLVSSLLVAGGGWALWSAGDVMQADGLEAGERLLRVGQWTVALGISVWGLLAVVRENRCTPAAEVRWTDWAKALVLYWFMCFVLAFVEGVIITLGRTPAGEFR